MQLPKGIASLRHRIFAASSRFNVRLRRMYLLEAQGGSRQKQAKDR